MGLKHLYSNYLSHEPHTDPDMTLNDSGSRKVRAENDARVMIIVVKKIKIKKYSFENWFYLKLL